MKQYLISFAGMATLLAIGLLALDKCSAPGNPIGALTGHNYSVNKTTAIPTLEWSIDNDANPPVYGPATCCGQCSLYSGPTDTSLDFPFVRNGVCYRDQVLPFEKNPSGHIFQIPLGQVATWKFQVYSDIDAWTMFWQIHPYKSSAACYTPLVSLNVKPVSGLKPPLNWEFNHYHQDYQTPYTPKTTVTFKIKALVTEQSNGYVDLWMNGVKVSHTVGQTVGSGCGDFWNFGPYVPTWQYTNNPGTKAKETFNYMELYYP